MLICSFGFIALARGYNFGVRRSLLSGGRTQKAILFTMQDILENTQWGVEGHPGVSRRRTVVLYLYVKQRKFRQ